MQLVPTFLRRLAGDCQTSKDKEEAPACNFQKDFELFDFGRLAKGKGTPQVTPMAQEIAIVFLK